MDNGQSHSPIPTKVPVIPSIELLSFFDALKEVLKGNKITRASWEPQLCYGLLNNGILTIFVKGSFHSWTVSDGDLEGEDWVVIPNE